MRKLNSRNIHRYLSIVIGVQLLFWSVSGVIFSWNPIKSVRGEHLVRKAKPIDLASHATMEIGEVVARHESELGSRFLVGAELRAMLGKPIYQLTFSTPTDDPGQQLIFDAVTGEKLSPVTEEQARQIAQQDFLVEVPVISAELIDRKPGSHSEYRRKELPAWRVVLDHPTGTVIYVSANRGVVTTRRNNRWRVFDFFWMLHTMDYQGRDNFNSWLLKSFSIFGVTTVLSGYWLWWRSSRLRQRLRKSRKKVQIKETMP